MVMLLEIPDIHEKEKMESLPEPPNPELEEMKELWEDIRILLRQFPAESFIPQS